MTDHNEVADLLDGAADIIERDGWCQGAFESNGAVCALGALNKAAGSDPNCGITRNPVGQAVFQLLTKRTGGNILVWNDRHERTEQEVLDLFRVAAKHERATTDGIDL
jgi:hypothetical protein